MDVVTTGGKRRLIQRRACRKDGLTKARRKRFLDVLAETCNVRMSAEAAGVVVSTAYVLRRRDPEFAGLWQEALLLGYERLEEALLSHALQGINDIVIGEEEASAQTIADPASPGTRYVGSGLANSPISPGAVQLALALLNRHRASVQGKPMTGGRRPVPSTPEQTDAALRKRLDMLARRLKDDQ